jgi:hypothetical protein
MLPKDLLSWGIRFLRSIVVLLRPVGGNSTPAEESLTFMPLSRLLCVTFLIAFE